MSQYKSDFLNAIAARGQFHQASDLDGLDAAWGPGLMGYIGYDMTAAEPSCRQSRADHDAAAAPSRRAGGRSCCSAAAPPGSADPSGRDETRQLLGEARSAANRASIRGVFDRLLKVGDGPSDAIMVDNSDWLLELNWSNSCATSAGTFP